MARDMAVEGLPTGQPEKKKKGMSRRSFLKTAAVDS